MNFFKILCLIEILKCKLLYKTYTAYIMTTRYCYSKRQPLRFCAHIAIALWLQIMFAIHSTMANSELKFNAFTPCGEFRVVYNNYGTFNAAAGICRIESFKRVKRFAQEHSEPLVSTNERKIGKISCFVRFNNQSTASWLTLSHYGCYSLLERILSLL